MHSIVLYYRSWAVKHRGTREPQATRPGCSCSRPPPASALRLALNEGARPPLAARQRSIFYIIDDLSS